MRRYKFGNTKIYVIPGTAHRFRTEHDAKFYCDEHGIDFATVEKYDSQKELERWNALQLLEREGIITGLRRQVEFELIPTQSVDYEVEKMAHCYQVDSGAFVSVFNTRAEAVAYCRANGIAQKMIRQHDYKLRELHSRIIEKAADYTADFVYKRDGKEVVEDVKSEATRKEADYVLRRKLMLWRHGIRILET
jgi:hypothetical protein